MNDRKRSPQVTAIVLNWNGLRDTRECLESVARLDYPDVRVVVVDNGSTDGSPAIIRDRFPSVTLLRNERNLGFSAGNNAGIREGLNSGADFLWLLNNDAVVERDTLRKLVDATRNSPEVGLASPFIHFHEAPDRIQFCGSYVDWKNRRIVKLREGDPFPEQEVDISLWGTALLVKRTVVERIGYLNEKYFAYHEDEEYCLRATRAGFRCVVVPGARVFHKNSRSTGSNDAPMQVFLRARNLFFLWADPLKGTARLRQSLRYLSRIVSYGGELWEKDLPESVEACLDGVWHAFRGAGGPRDPAISMPNSLRALFRLSFSWHPFLWSSLLEGDLTAIASNIGRRMSKKSST